MLVIRLLTEISSELGFRVQVQVFLEGRDLLDFYVYIIRNQFIKKKLRKMNYIRTLCMSDLQDDDSSIM